MKKLRLSVDTAPKPIDPIQVFQKLTLRGSIENIWDPQAEALREWHQRRHTQDVAIEMNTGGGKTMVGLLIAQSIVNETKGKVLYVCANNQLVEQTLERAREIGLSPATRYKRGWSSRDDFDLGNTFCLTNYATVFNGKSIFYEKDLSALVFDDAHVAENSIRGQFTLEIPSSKPQFSQILNLCRSHFANSGKVSHFEDVISGRSRTVMFIPMYLAWRRVAEFRKILLDGGVEEDQSTLFAWEHLKNSLDRCCYLADGSRLQITPPLPPLRHLSYFQGKTRRVFLTATLPSSVSFARTFGVSNVEVIRPTGKTGDAQRLFVFVPGADDDVQLEESKSLVANLKSCVISPSEKSGRRWTPPAIVYDGAGGQGEISRFSASSEPLMLSLIARYDGIDLPGSACRVVVLDGLPRGESLIDRFIDQGVRIETIRISQTATRIVQAIGRIFRSNTDHGVVLLVGGQLQSWLRGHTERAYLPDLVQRQLLLGVELGKQTKTGSTSWAELIDGVLEGDRNWDEMYNNYIDEFETSVASVPPEWHVELVLDERAAFGQLWEGQFQRSADLYEGLCRQAGLHDARLEAWYRHWRGLALLCSGARPDGLLEFMRAANVRTELGRPEERMADNLRPKGGKCGFQAKELAGRYRQGRTTAIDEIGAIKRDLVYGGNVGRAEDALSRLGALIGVSSERPDKSVGTGPDVLWRDEAGESVWGFELKTDKKKGGEYSKRDVSQCHDHREWLTTNYGDHCELMIVGRLLSVSEKANPGKALKIAELDGFRDMVGRVEAMTVGLEGSPQGREEGSIQAWLEHLGLVWPRCVESLKSRLAVDLQGE